MSRESEEEAFEGGRAMVREGLVNRLAAAGLRPRKGVSAAAHARVMDHLVQWLAYMAPENLQVLAESVLTHASQPGPDMGIWPSEVTIRSWAGVLQPKPFRMHPVVASWLRSREGPVALSGGYLVPLLRWLKRHRRPLMSYDLIEVKREGADLQKRVADALARQDAGYAWPGDADLLETWARDLAEARQYVDEGEHGRALKAAVSAGVAA